ncbi:MULTISPECIES: GntR family transcriptional regulator [unclassified Ruegeria]|uniref:GntR family transcriptional regulator n=1 Tax=unclassified Ruegeria TaxID=2625375 RepID=UPI001489258A|nr:MULTISPECIES: GntR family transcriptional regulator [unclassified Ruegeria]NOD64857.1 FCD domain-containing protein [Ruegeria sp. HKCCD6109]NOD77629.1 FCD domain-containing protein [Ruegeria sp. HKCCD4332]NOD89833.1 FCD domain-containing protein [Ruegeria sp. HKCCD4318]NOD94509.1 FCD domain-containing protein [Ruegeria sp. HKCCD4884]NOE14721.1 FCD domain-containing protein [Ruegeria sp. HKCCD4318-2]
MSKQQDINAALLPEITTIEGPLAQRVHHSLKQAILSLDFPPGANLRKAPVCERLGVSRAPVADAIARLASEGLVDVVPQSGTRVSYFSMDEIREGVFLREALELATVAKVARDLTDDQRKRLSRNMRLQELLIEDEDIPGFYQADEEFHGLLMEFTGFRRLADVAQTVSLQVSRARMLLLPTPGRIAETLAEHRAIFEAISNRDEQAAQDAMRTHLGQLMPRIELLEQQKPHLFNLTPQLHSEAG